jgi:hypothetical protein
MKAYPEMITSAASVGSQSAHRSRPVFESAVVGLDRVVGVLLDAVPGGRHQFVEHRGVDRAAAVMTSTGVTFNVASARWKNRRAWAASRRAQRGAARR